MRRKGTLTLRRDDGRIVCETVVVADRWGRRLRGLLGKRRLHPGQGLLLRPCFSIQTMFMRFPIDAVFLDHDLVVLKIDSSLKPFRTSSCRGAREVVELSAGECARRGLAVGDHVAWASQVQTVDGVPVAPTDLSEEATGRDEPRGSVVLASSDARFVKLARFLLDGKGIEVTATVPPEKLAGAVQGENTVDAVVLDAQDAVSESLKAANAARALRPEVPIFLVGEGRAAERAPAGVEIYDKWNETDELLAAIERSLRDDDVETDEPAVHQSS